jgi:multimeric flavodoxin WrbA
MISIFFAMKIIAVNGATRPAGTTTRLARAALEGAAELGAETEMLMLRDCRLGHCVNCLKCQRDLASEIAPCALADDADGIVVKLRDADGVIFASPVHCGFVSGLLVMLIERMAWRLMRPSGCFLGAMGMESRLASKTRAAASILSAGGMPPKLRKLCDDGTPWLKNNLPLMLHAQWIGDMYAGAVLERLPETRADWTQVYFLRRLADEQLAEARALGTKMAAAIRDGKLAAVTLASYAGPVVRGLVSILNRFNPPYRTVKNNI